MYHLSSSNDVVNLLFIVGEAGDFIKNAVDDVYNTDDVDRDAVNLRAEDESVAQ